MINVKRMIEFCWQHEEDIRRAIAEKRLDNGGVVTGGIAESAILRLRKLSIMYLTCRV